MISKIVEVFRKAGLVDDSNDRIITVGLQRLISTVMDFLFAMVCSLIMGNIFVGIFFEICYGALRIYAGGYHASNEKVCKYLTYISTLGSILIIFLVPFKENIMHWIMLISIGMIVFLAPMESENKPLSKTEKKIYYMHCIGIAVVEVILYTIFIYFKISLYANTILISILLVVIGMLFGKIKKNHSFSRKPL